ncbi:hypothetical protein HMI55_004412 [Coelomomyces lativittatus]|nr:hypothetical protein HMI55_004412 [Coelomomyces lativittatus]
MLTSTASPSSFSFGGLSPQTQLENEKLSLQLQQGSPFVLTSELLYSQAQSLKSRMQLKNEDVYHKLEKLQELLTDALMDGKDKKEEKKENHAKLSIKIDADPSYYDKKTNRNSRTPSAPTLTTSIKHPFLSLKNLIAFFIVIVALYFIIFIHLMHKGI